MLNNTTYIYRTLKKFPSIPCVGIIFIEKFQKKQFQFQMSKNFDLKFSTSFIHFWGGNNFIVDYGLKATKWHRYL